MTSIVSSGKRFCRRSDRNDGRGRMEVVRKARHRGFPQAEDTTRVRGPFRSWNIWSLGSGILDPEGGKYLWATLRLMQLNSLPWVFLDDQIEISAVASDAEPRFAQHEDNEGEGKSDDPENPCGGREMDVWQSVSSRRSVDLLVWTRSQREPSSRFIKSAAGSKLGPCSSMRWRLWRAAVGVSGMQVRLCDQILRLLACFRMLSILESLAEVHDRGVRPASVESQCAEGIECIVRALNCQRLPQNLSGGAALPVRM